MGFNKWAQSLTQKYFSYNFLHNSCFELLRKSEQKKINIHSCSETAKL